VEQRQTVIFSVIKKIVLLTLILFVVLFQSGCFEYDEQIVMNPNGSGKLFIHYQAEKEMKFQNLYFPIDKYEVDYNLKNNYDAEGITNKTQDIIQKNKSTHVYMGFDFENLDNFASAARFQNEEFSVAENDGKITLQRFLYFDENKLDRSKLLLKSGIKSFFNQGILNEIYFRFQWVVPGEIIESNATLLGDKNRAIWTTTLAEILENRSTQFSLTYLPTQK
jgi:hypothetical protein